MAIFHFAAKILGRTSAGSAARSVVAAAAYRAGTRLTCERTGTIKNYAYKQREVLHSEINAPAHAPAFTHNRAMVWNEVERIERRRDAQLAREVMVAIPVELSPEQQIDLLRGYVQQAFVAEGMLADWSIHAKPGNPHCHILLTLREIGPEGFGAKTRSWNAPERLERWRALWAEHCNLALASAGSDERIDHRSLAAQGISHREPTQHVGRDNGLNSAARAERLEHNALQQARDALHRIKHEEAAIHRQIAEIESTILDLRTTLAQALAEREHTGVLHPETSPILTLDEAHEMRAAQPPPGGLVLPWSRVAHDPGATPDNHHQPYGGIKP
jgi:hypothetical protein